MVKRYIVWLSLITMANSIVGCSHTVYIKTDETKRPVKECDIGRVDLRPIIASLQTADGVIVQFDSCGGRFLPERGEFAGLTAESDSIQVGLDQVIAVREYKDPVYRETSSSADLSRFISKRWVADSHILHVDTLRPTGPQVELSEGTGCFSPDGSRITGRTVGGDYIDVSMTEVMVTYSRETRPSVTKTALLVGIPLLTFVAICIGYSQADGGVTLE
jgi:hypothetical protein